MSGAATGEAFAGSREHFETIVGWLDGDDAAGLTHSELEAQLDARGRALLRGLLQDHLDVRASREVRIGEVVDAVGVPRGAVEAGHRRALGTIFGQVEVERLAYRAKGHANLHPANATLNLPVGKHSAGLRRLAHPTALARVLAHRHRHHRGRLPPPRQGPHGPHVRRPLGLRGAAAILQLRALRSSGDFDDYWHFHLAREHQRVHRSRYANN